MKNPMIKSVSDTAKWVAACRALGSEQKDACFNDPFARELAGDDGFRIFENLGYSRRFIGSIAVRTVIIDNRILDLAHNDGVDTIINLAAGLDARPYRLNLPQRLRWIDIDVPHILEYKKSKLIPYRPNCNYECISLDLSERILRQQIFGQINSVSTRALILSEGFLMYLTEDQVVSLARDLAGHSNLSLWLAQIISPLLARSVERVLNKNSNGDRISLGFCNPEGPKFFERFGWSPIDYYSILEVSNSMHIRVAQPWKVRFLQAFAPKGIRQRFDSQIGGIVLMKRSPGNL